MKIYNTLTRKAGELNTLEPNYLGMYACGLTPYDYSHLGHAMQGVIFDVLRRYFEFKGFKVTYVRNYTDVDDKIINAANQKNINPLDLSKEMIDFINILLSKGVAYVTSSNNIYFRVNKFMDYGKLSNQKVEKLFEGVRKDTEPDKEDAKDFALWKASKPGEPFWNSPWGKGRPGWHLECSVMSKRYLGETFDIHGRGMDLIFPHHENEIAQSESAHGKAFAKFWVHNGLMTLNGEKMSKSTKNYVLLRDALKRFHSQTIRYLILTNHYRSDHAYHDKRFRDGQMRVYYFYKTLAAHNYQYKAQKANLENKLIKQFIKYMDNDFSTVEVFSLLDRQFKMLNDGQLSGSEITDFFDLLSVVGKVFGIFNKDPQEVLEEIKELELTRLNIDRETINNVISERKTLREQGKYDEADKLRDNLLSKEINVSDY
ncbi:cysteine--tRNA ligase [Candidatus Daviesbacteria bacterium]|nr:cysteine--tRNA ligase [Candidatus Daviesbacteria bacterium]